MMFVEDHWESYEEPTLAHLRRPRRARHAVPAAHRPRAGPAVGTVHGRGHRPGRPVRRPADGRLQLDPDGRAAHPADRRHRARVPARADQPATSRGCSASRCPASAGHLLEYRLGQQGHDAMGFAVHVPHYLAQTDYPEAAELLLTSLSTATGLLLATDDLRESAAGRAGRGRPADRRERGRRRAGRVAGAAVRRVHPRPHRRQPAGRRPARCRRPRSWAPSWSGSSPTSPTRPATNPTSRPLPASPRHPADRGLETGDRRRNTARVGDDDATH